MIFRLVSVIFAKLLYPQPAYSCNSIMFGKSRSYLVNIQFSKEVTHATEVQTWMLMTFFFYINEQDESKTTKMYVWTTLWQWCECFSVDQIVVLKYWKIFHQFFVLFMNEHTHWSSIFIAKFSSITFLGLDNQHNKSSSDLQCFPISIVYILHQDWFQTTEITFLNAELGRDVVSHH